VVNSGAIGPASYSCVLRLWLQRQHFISLCAAAATAARSSNDQAHIRMLPLVFFHVVNTMG
jgi:hypothetical protein